MGLILELVDEVLPIRPKSYSRITDIDIEKKIRTERFTLRHAIPNAFFQIIDCIIMPVIAWVLVKIVLKDFSILYALLAVFAVFSSVFSIWQFLYYFIKPVDTYLSFWYRFLGETALGCLLSALFRLHFKIKLP